MNDDKDIPTEKMLKKSVLSSTSSSITNKRSETVQKKGLLQESLIDLYKSGLYTDVNIHVKWRGETTEFRTHKLVLATRSAVFGKEFQNKESFSIVTFVVEGVNPQLIRLLLWYFYTDDLIAETPKQIIGFAKVAKYYKVKSVDRLCKDILSHYVVEDTNVWSLLDAALFFKIDPLYYTCKELIQRNLKRILLQKEFLSISKEALTIFETELSQHLTRDESLQAVLRWLEYNKQADRSVLLKYDIASLSIDGFLDVLESFPSFLSAEDALGILANKIRPGVMELPGWYDSTSKSTVSENVTFVSISVAMVAERSLRLELAFEEQLSKSSLFGSSGFECTMTLQLKLANEFSQHLKVIMFELAFGSNFVPEDSLDIQLFCHQYGIQTIKKKRIKILLHSTPDNYYVIAQEICHLDKIVPFIFTFEVEAKGLRRWRGEDPLPNNRYRVMQIPENNVYSTSLSVGTKKAVILTTLSDWLVFVDPKEGTKNFVFTAFYFDKE